MHASLVGTTGLHLIGLHLIGFASHTRASYTRASYKCASHRYTSYGCASHRHTSLIGMHLSKARISYITMRAPPWLSHCVEKGVVRKGCLKRVSQSLILSLGAQLNLYEPASSNRNAAYSQHTTSFSYEDLTICHP